jgi:hypothetical protein
VFIESVCASITDNPYNMIPGQEYFLLDVELLETNDRSRPPSMSMSDLTMSSSRADILR